jgi:hypothetical protein
MTNLNSFHFDLQQFRFEEPKERNIIIFIFYVLTFNYHNH